MENTATGVDTARIAEVRVLRFETPGAMWAEVERIVTAERAGGLKRTGNWSVGQTLGHLAAWIDFAYEGYPVRPPLVLRWVLRPFKKRFLRGPLPRGRRIPGVKGGTLGIEERSTEDGLARLRAAWSRLEAGAPAGPNPIFGRMTHEEWVALHLRHAELHLGFLHPG